MALDTAADNLDAVETAAALAARLRAELIGLFVEDIDLVRLAEHSDVRTFSTWSAPPQRFASDQLKCVLRTQLARSRQAVEQAAARQRVKSTFQVRQGRLSTEVRTVAEDADLVIVSWAGGKASLSLVTRTTISVTRACSVAEDAARSVLLLRPGTATGSLVMVAYDGSEKAGQALAAAVDMVDRDHGAMEVVLLANRLDNADAWREKLSAELAEAEFPIRFVHLPKASADNLCRIAEREQASLMVLPANLDLLRGEPLARFVNQLSCSVLLIHPERAMRAH